jgi:hypothetical protein
MKLKIKTCLQNGFWNHEIKVKNILLINEGLDNIFEILDFELKLCKWNSIGLVLNLFQ